jgi:hypothetical protein
MNSEKFSVVILCSESTRVLTLENLWKEHSEVCVSN